MRRALIILLAIAGLLTFAVFALVLLDNPKARVAAVRKHFENIPGTRLTYISDLEKQASQVITAYVEVEGKGEIGFIRLSPDSFRHSSHVYLHGIGPYDFRSRRFVGEQQAYGYDIDIGPTSPVPAVRKLGISSVQSAISHFDDLLAIIENWPVITNEWPRSWPVDTGDWSRTSEDEVRFVDSAGRDIFYCLKRSDTEVSR